MFKTLNFAHRGFRSKYPENTMLAFSKAANLGVDGIEFDVHLSSDGVPIIIHDEALDRTCNASGLVKDFSFAELKKINAAANFKSAESFSGTMPLDERIPSLEEYFDFIKNKNIISNIELKTGVFEYSGIEEKVYALLKQYDLQEKCIISSFNHESVLRMKKIAPSLVCGFLVDSWDLHPADYLKKYGIECYHPPAYRLTKEFVEELHNEGFKVNAWFGSIQTDYAQVLSTGLDAIITDYPDKIADLLKK
ncbi:MULTISPECIES: glycerophosphodiester phosphodiesterase [unclassified Treponema]|uniref:glycerophosphodiester phosphodiesterase n=1 Tax=unclassified Treponema TaxID=2638727 RepID=UPI0020A5200A|nr:MULTISPECIES: glycerophosphodiester phosphodiesterase [unclassified Treponema]UTC66230.1 glycerophosphodiester phosphodiesterase [Treponema sp. OMZ 789]UTC68959.1 glycerophosphodiester phosphodiesterase [Treponema sp. OMZ 790]UTC71686.1 glycerophosphodiester phosphodiesterase [Treponema sp. OMZ 791]